jgi:PhoH-like ATPase
MNKIIRILDTNILLYDPNALFNFPDDIIILHFSVLGELESFKKESSERGYNARETIRLLDELRAKGSLNDGITLNNCGEIFIHMPVDTILNGLTDSVDDQIIRLGIHLKNQGKNIIIVSQDFTVRIKADLFNLKTIDYKNEGITKDNFYQGWKEFIFPSGDIKFKAESLLKEIQKDYNFVINEFAILKSQHANDFYRIFRYIGPNHFIEVRSDDLFLWGIEAKNPQQEMVMNLLMDDTVQLVVLCGPSGTGKTFMVLASMLYKVLCTKTYQKLLVSRPLVPLGPDVGYLPGDLFEKLQSWMQPIKDNLEYLLYQMNENYNSNNTYCEDESKKKNKNKKSGTGLQSINKQKLNMEDLLGPDGIISLEAITYMRGRSIPYQAIFIDEVQNLTPHEVKTLISRAGEGSKIILVGDPYQIDSPYLDFVTNGLVVASEKFKGQAVFGSVYLKISERSILSSLANLLM